MLIKAVLIKAGDAEPVKSYTRTDTAAVLGSSHQTHLRGAEKRIPLSCIAGSALIPLTSARVCIGNTSTFIIDSGLRLVYCCGAHRGSVTYIQTLQCKTGIVVVNGLHFLCVERFSAHEK